MIARTWRGETAAATPTPTSPTSRQTGLPGYRATPGNRGAYLLRRDARQTTEFVTALVLGRPRRRPAPSPATTSTVAVFYPEDDRFLTASDLVAHHYEVASPRHRA